MTAFCPITADYPDGAGEEAMEKMKVRKVKRKIGTLPYFPKRSELQGGFMPTISMFYGILVLMFFRDNNRHHAPHIHVRYQSDEAVVSITEGIIIDGNLPPKQLKMVQAWIEIHRKS